MEILPETQMRSIGEVISLESSIDVAGKLLNEDVTDRVDVNK
ncbi:oxidoreductase, zinc-binding protein [Colwellia psychrerythraea]|uniref:Oxidoreductase, zinc-binding protein n=1 Tax=Colwellia psychrerythraea TaxID=28229 RepID=A0A099L2K2_COLPS|nr:oxidoreductase, zinc-binding protein [Colwellia psychrerythraea]